MNKSAASAASLDYVKFQAVIKSTASADFRKPKSRWGTPLELPSLVLGFLEAALAADLIMARSSLQGGCAGRRLDAQHALNHTQLHKNAESQKDAAVTGTCLRRERADAETELPSMTCHEGTCANGTHCCQTRQTIRRKKVHTTFRRFPYP